MLESGIPSAVAGQLIKTSYCLKSVSEQSSQIYCGVTSLVLTQWKKRTTSCTLTDTHVLECMSTQNNV